MRSHSKVPGRHELWKGYFPTRYNSQIKINHQNQNMEQSGRKWQIMASQNCKKLQKLWSPVDPGLRNLSWKRCSFYHSLNPWETEVLENIKSLNQNSTKTDNTDPDTLYTLKFGIRYRWTFTYMVRSGIAKKWKAGEEIFQLKGLSFNYLGMGHGHEF